MAVNSHFSELQTNICQKCLIIHAEYVRKWKNCCIQRPM